MKPHEINSAPPKQPLARLAYTTFETATLLGLSEVTIYRLLKRGILRSCSGLRHKLISAAEIERFLNNK